MNRLPSWLLTALLGLAISMSGVTLKERWSRLDVSLHARRVLRQPIAAWTLQSESFSLLVIGSHNAQQCAAALAAIRRLPPGYWLDETMHRLVRFVSLSCEDDAGVVQRFRAESSAGLKVSSMDVLYVSEALARLGRHDEALILQQKMPEISLRYVELGRNAIERLNDEAGGLAYFDLAERIDPTYQPLKASMYMYRCMIALRDGDRPWGYAPCEDFAHAAPEAALSHLLLGRSYLAKRDPALAIAHIRDALRLAPQMGDAYYWLGTSLLAEGDTAGGKEAFDRGLAQDATYPWNYLARAQLAIADRDQRLAVQLLCSMIRLSDSDAIAAARRLLETMGHKDDEARCDQ